MKLFAELGCLVELCLADRDDDYLPWLVGENGANAFLEFRSRRVDEWNDDGCVRNADGW